MNKENILKQFILSLYIDGWINIEITNFEEFDEWFDIQYNSRLASWEKKMFEIKKKQIN